MDINLNEIILRNNILKHNDLILANKKLNNENAANDTNKDTSINQREMNSSVNQSPKSRPLPQFFAESVNFSTKKERDTPKMSEIFPPKPPIKSCPPISRLRPQCKPDYDGARAVSFLNKKSPNDSDLISKHYDENKKDLYFEQCFIIEGSLGCGSFGKVYKVKSKEDGKYYAIKKSKEKFKGHADRVRKLEEVAKHEELPPHQNCVKFFRAWEEKQRLYIQIELCELSLSSYAERHHNIPEDVIWQFLVDLLQAVKHLHDRKLVHMDIKPDNIFISHDGVCKLGDFGLVIDLKKNDLREVQEGDPKYLAPEVLNNNNNITLAADVFSLGMTILELATDLDLPRGGDPWHQLRNNQIPSHLISSLSKELVEIIMKMIEPDHLKRANVNQLLSMPKVKRLIAQNKRKLFYEQICKSFKNVYYSVYSFSMTIWYFIVYPWLKFQRYIRHSDSKHLLINSNNESINNQTENENQQTSTPKKLNLSGDTPMALMNLADMHDDEHDYVYGHDSFNNNSYLSPLMLDSDMMTSSSFSDHSDQLSMSHKYNNQHQHKARTEPPIHKIPNKSNLVKIPLSPTAITSTTAKMGSPECKTPPWKPATSFVSFNGGESVTPIGPTRQKLIFDDDKENENINGNANFKFLNEK